jgi:hypothetical protein
MIRPRAAPRARVYSLGLAEENFGGPSAGRFADYFATAIARNLARNVYAAVTLFAGDVIFDEIGVLQAHEFDSEAVLDVTDHPALGLADGDHGADRRPQLG